jgi:hypothetical protein
MLCFLGMFAKLQKVTVSFVMSVCLSVHPFVHLTAWNSLVATGWILIKLDVLRLFLKSFEKSEISLKSNKNNGYFT